MTWAAPWWFVVTALALGAWGFGWLMRLRSRGGERTRAIKSGVRAVTLDHGRIRPVSRHVGQRPLMTGFWLGAAALSLALARPQAGWIELPRFEQAREVVIALDLSKSMWATDVKPTRLDRARLLVGNLLDHLKGERVGLVLFAGTAFTQSPLSSDYEVLREFLPVLDPNFLPQGGTNYAAMLDTVLEAFGGKTAGESDRYLIVLSDGESQDGEWQSRLDPLKNLGVRVIALGVGTAEGSVIPDPAGGLVKRADGSVVLSRLNPSTLQALARRSGGVYYQADTWIDLAAILQQTVETGRKGSFSDQSDRKPIERYALPLLVAIVLWAWSLWREFPVRPRLKSSKPAAAPSIIPDRSRPPSLPSAMKTRRSATALLAVLLGASVAFAQASTPEAAAEPAPDPLLQTVATLSARSRLGPDDFAQMAQITIQRGNEGLQERKPLPRGAVEDALRAVFEGESAAPTAHDWPRLREELEKLLDTPPSEDKKDDSSSSENQSDPSQNQNSSQSNDSSKSSSGSPSDQQKDQGDNNNQDSNNSSQQPQGDSPSSPSENQKSPDSPENQSPGQPPSNPPEDRSDRSLGPMNDQDQEEKKNNSEDSDNKNSPASPAEAQKQGQDKPSPPPPSRKIQGATKPGLNSEGADAEAGVDATTLRKLDELSRSDRPARLFQALQDPDSPQPQKDNDW